VDVDIERRIGNLSLYAQFEGDKRVDRSYWINGGLAKKSGSSFPASSSSIQWMSPYAHSLIGDAPVLEQNPRHSLEFLHVARDQGQAGCPSLTCEHHVVGSDGLTLLIQRSQSLIFEWVT